MESASLMALLFVGAVGRGRSAQPNAPQIIARPSLLSAAWTSNVVRDGNLITGQNPQSSEDVAKEVIKALG